MTVHLKRNLLLGLALAAVLAGGILAVTSGGTHHGRAAKANQALSRGSAPTEVQLAANYLGISRAELRRRLETGATMAEVAAATPGKSASGLIAALLAPYEATLKAKAQVSAAEREALARSRAQIVAETNHGRGRTGLVPTAASYLGLSTTALRAELRQGLSLAEVAQARGHSRAGLIEALVLRKAQRLNAALAEHAITPREERTALASLRSRVSASVEERRSASSG